MLAYLSLLTNSMQKNEDIIWFFQEILTIKESNPPIWLDERHKWHNQPQVVISDAAFPW